MIVGYLRVSTGGQTVENQRLAIYDAGYHPDEWFEVQASSRKSTTHRRIDELLGRLSSGDKIVVSELSRLGRSVGQIAVLVNNLTQAGTELHCLKENIRLNGAMDMQSKVMVTMFSLFAEIERDLISERTKEGLTRAVGSGKKLGRPKGTQASRLDTRRDEIALWVQQKVSKASIAKMLGVSWSTVDHFIRTRKIE